MAAALPEAEFVGIDLSPRQIDQGQAIVARLGFKNVALRAMSLLDVGDDFGWFDYIICHGVYSWVPAEARDKILAIFAANMEPDGVAYLSYNTYPGWHLRGMVRDMLRFHANGYSGLQTRVKEARAMLDFVIKSASTEEETYCRVLKDEQAELEGLEDAYLFHEHLEEVNHPVYFTDLIAAAAAHDLSYLGPSWLDPVDDAISPHARAVIDKFGTDRIRREQYLDFLRNRTFRKSLFCHADRPHHDAPSLEAIGRLRFSSFAKPESAEPAVTSDAPEEFCSPANVRLTTSKPLVKAALMALFSNRPRSLTLDELWVEVQALLGPSLDGARQSLAEVLLKANRANLVVTHVFEPSIVASVSERPIASLIARYQAEAGLKICNLRHFNIGLDNFSSLTIRLLDGSRDREAILATLSQWVAQGHFLVSRDGQSIQDETQLREVLSVLLDESLVSLAKNGLLVG